MEDDVSGFRVQITCDDHGQRPRVIDSFIYAAHGETGREQWFWEADLKIGGGKKQATGDREWSESEPSHQTVREDFPDGLSRVRLRCRNHGHADIGIGWTEFVDRYLEPCRGNGIHEVPVRIIVSTRTSPTRRRPVPPPASGPSC